MQVVTIDVDDRRTWPRAVRDAVRLVADRLAGTASYTSDLRPGDGEEDRFRAQLPGPLRAYHATRLLPHEVSDIREHGLRPLTRDLVHRRVDDALAHGHITLQERDALHGVNVFDTHDADGRRDQVCLFLSRRVLDEDIAAVWRLLTIWGGEGIHMADGSTEFRPLLTSLGQPAIVVVDVDLHEPHHTHPVWPGVLKCFVGRQLGFREWGADVMIQGPVPATAIVDVWQPGHPEFDRHGELLDA